MIWKKPEPCLKLVKESNVKLQVGHVERFNPAFLALEGIPLHPMFIEVHRLAEFNPRGTEVSVILDLMIHDIDIILHIVKQRSKKHLFQRCCRYDGYAGYCQCAD